VCVVGIERDSADVVSDASMAICISKVDVGESGGECGRVGEVEGSLRLFGGGVSGSTWLPVVVVVHE
jgi:hypothetical protein